MAKWPRSSFPNSSSLRKWSEGDCVRETPITALIGGTSETSSRTVSFVAEGFAPLKRILWNLNWCRCSYSFHPSQVGHWAAFGSHRVKWLCLFYLNWGQSFRLYKWRGDTLPSSCRYVPAFDGVFLRPWATSAAFTVTKEVERWQS